jgi:hypothetical protein
VVTLAGSSSSGNIGLSGEALMIALADMVICQNPNMELWGLSNANFHLYAKLRAKFPNEYKEEYAEIEGIVKEIESEMEDFGTMLGGIEAKRDVWKKVNRIYAILSEVLFDCGVIHDARMQHFGKLE